MYNAYKNVDYDAENSILREMLTSILDQLRGMLYSRGIRRGQCTYRTSMVLNFDLLRDTHRKLESKFPVLQYASALGIHPIH